MPPPALVALVASDLRESDMRGRVIYLSGPMTGIKDLNYPRFNHVAQMLREARNVVYNPAEFDHHGKFPLREAFAEYSAFITNRADTLYMLDGWHSSKGARAEWWLAYNCGVEILYESDVGSRYGDKILNQFEDEADDE